MATLVATYMPAQCQNERGVSHQGRSTNDAYKLPSERPPYFEMRNSKGSAEALKIPDEMQQKLFCSLALSLECEPTILFQVQGVSRKRKMVMYLDDESNLGLRRADKKDHCYEIVWLHASLQRQFLAVRTAFRDECSSQVTSHAQKAQKEILALMLQDSQILPAVQKQIQDHCKGAWKKAVNGVGNLICEQTRLEPEPQQGISALALCNRVRSRSAQHLSLPVGALSNEVCKKCFTLFFEDAVSCGACGSIRPARPKAWLEDDTPQNWPARSKPWREDDTPQIWADQGFCSKPNDREDIESFPSSPIAKAWSGSQSTTLDMFCLNGVEVEEPLGHCDAPL